MSFAEKLQELSALGAEIARRRHQIGTLELELCEPGDRVWPALRRDLLRMRLDLHLAETRRDVLRLELSWAISDRAAGALLDFSDLEDVAP